MNRSVQPWQLRRLHERRAVPIQAEPFQIRERRVGEAHFGAWTIQIFHAQ